jgi:hypothetical protein
MKILIAATVAVVALSSTAFAADAAHKPCASTASASDQAAPNTVVSAIVRPDGGGLASDPDVGALAMAPFDQSTPAEMPGY